LGVRGSAIEPETTFNNSTDGDGKQYCGLHIDWDYKARTCDISMPGYIARSCLQ
jgi:hypothetical protein